MAHGLDLQVLNRFASKWLALVAGDQDLWKQVALEACPSVLLMLQTFRQYLLLWVILVEALITAVVVELATLPRLEDIVVPQADTVLIVVNNTLVESVATDLADP